LASNALIFDGYLLDNQHLLHFRRPKEGTQMTGSTGQTTASTASNPISSHVADTPAKIFIGCIPFSLNEQDMIEILQSFGPLKSFHLVRDAQGNSKGYAFCDYQDPLLTDTACAGLNQFELLDKKLVVQRASQGKAQGGEGHQFGPMIVGSAGIQANVSTYATAASSLLPSLLKKGVAAKPSPVLQILNLWDTSDLPDLTMQDILDMQDDIREVCRQFGSVLNILIAAPPHLLPPSSSTDSMALQLPAHVWGKGFVEFETKAQAASAVDALAGRKFGESTILTCYYSHDLFIHKNFN
jgi:splicing factor U2AF 65 kDa subunit